MQTWPPPGVPIPGRGRREGPPAHQTGNFNTQANRGSVGSCRGTLEGRLPRVEGQTGLSLARGSHTLADVSQIPGLAVDDAHVPRAQ